MKLNVLERALALGLLPEKGDFATLRAVQEARTNLALTEDEVKEFNFVQNDKQLTWNIAGNEEREIALNSTAERIIREKLTEVDEKKELTKEFMSLFEKFVQV